MQSATYRVHLATGFPAADDSEEAQAAVCKAGYVLQLEQTRHGHQVGDRWTPTMICPDGTQRTHSVCVQTLGWQC